MMLGVNSNQKVLIKFCKNETFTGIHVRDKIIKKDKSIHTVKKQRKEKMVKKKI